MIAIGTRDSGPEDLQALEDLYPAAFPDEDLLPLVRALLRDPPVALSLVATVDSQVAGHAAFTPGRVDDADAKVALLGPLAVTPGLQRQGIGTAIVRAGLERLEQGGVVRVFVLGDPAYYSRFGFSPETRVETPCPIPEEWRTAWQSLSLRDTNAAVAGRLMVPEPWMKPELWS